MSNMSTIERARDMNKQLDAINKAHVRAESNRDSAMKNLRRSLEALKSSRGIDLLTVLEEEGIEAVTSKAGSLLEEYQSELEDKVSTAEKIIEAYSNNDYRQMRRFLNVADEEVPEVEATSEVDSDPVEVSDDISTPEDSDEAEEAFQEAESEDVSEDSEDSESEDSESEESEDSVSVEEDFDLGDEDEDSAVEEEPAKEEKPDVTSLFGFDDDDDDEDDSPTSAPRAENPTDEPASTTMADLESKHESEGSKATSVDDDEDDDDDDLSGLSFGSLLGGGPANL